MKGYDTSNGYMGYVEGNLFLIKLVADMRSLYIVSKQMVIHKKF